MDEAATEHVRQRYTRIGMIMEDASVTALRLGGSGNIDRRSAHDELLAAVAQINQLLDQVCGTLE